MPDVVMKLYAVLIDVILPNLNRIQASQVEQRAHTDRVNQNIEEFRAEMHMRFTELRAELAATHAQVEVAMAKLRESEAARTQAALAISKNSIVH
jgi:multidrug resistance efflux pump